MTTNQKKKKKIIESRESISAKVRCSIAGSRFWRFLPSVSDLPTVRSDKRARITASLQGTFRIEGGNLPGIWPTPRKLCIKKERSEKAISSVPQRAHPTPGGPALVKLAAAGMRSGCGLNPSRSRSS